MWASVAPFILKGTDTRCDSISSVGQFYYESLGAVKTDTLGRPTRKCEVSFLPNWESCLRPNRVRNCSQFGWTNAFHVQTVLTSSDKEKRYCSFAAIRTPPLLGACSAEFRTCMLYIYKERLGLPRAAHFQKLSMIKESKTSYRGARNHYE